MLRLFFTIAVYYPTLLSYIYYKSCSPRTENRSARRASRGTSRPDTIWLLLNLCASRVRCFFGGVLYVVRTAAF